MADKSESPSPKDGQNHIPHSFDDELYDPFTPEKAYVQAGEDGPVVVDVLKTVENYDRAMLPELRGENLELHDKVRVTFDDETCVSYEITDTTLGSLDFGTDDIGHPRVGARSTDGTDVVIVGSSISPSGGMLTPGSVITGYHLQT